MLLGVAGVLAIVSGFSKWASISFPRSGSASATELVGNDTVALIVGFFLLFRAYMTWRGSEAEARRWGGWAIFSGGILLGYAVYDLVTLRTRVLDSLVANTAASAGVSEAEVRAIVERQVADGVVRFAVRPGLSLALAAGAIAIVAGVLSLTVSSTGKADEPEVAAGPGTEDRTHGLTWVEPDASGTPHDASGTERPPDGGAPEPQV